MKHRKKKKKKKGEGEEKKINIWKLIGAWSFELSDFRILCSTVLCALAAL